MFGLFGKTNDNVLKLGGILSNQKITIENGIVSYRGAYGDKAMVIAKQIQSITLSPNGFGKSDIVITGNGSELARIKKIPSSWAENATHWLITKLDLS